MAKGKAEVVVTDQQVRVAFNTFVRLGLLTDDRKTLHQFASRIRSRQAYDETNLDVYRGGYHAVSAAVHLDERTARVDVIVRPSMETVHNPELTQRIVRVNNNLKSIFG